MALPASSKINWWLVRSMGGLLLHTPRWTFAVRPPGSTMLFSERQGMVINLGFGWRFTIRVRSVGDRPRLTE